MCMQGEKFALKFRFDNQYPISAPAVQFVVDDRYTAPIHPVRPHSIPHAHALPPVARAPRSCGF